MSRNFRTIVLTIIYDTLERHKNLDDTLHNLNSLSSENRSKAFNLVLGAIRYKLQLDYLITTVSGKSKQFIQKRILCLLRLAVYELQHMSTPNYAVIHEYVQIAKGISHKSSGFVNAILRKLTSQHYSLPQDMTKIHDISIYFSHPEWFVSKLITTYGQETALNILQCNNIPPAIHIRVNRLKTTVDQLLHLFHEHAIEARPSDLINDFIIVEKHGNVKNFPGYTEGLWSIQSLTAGIMTSLLAPQHQDVILDLCAAPGGKTTYLAELSDDQAHIIACDISEERLHKLQENIQRLHLTSIQSQCLNSSNISGIQADKILVDVPCSSSGVFHRNPDARWHKNLAQLDMLSKNQLEILTTASKCLKKGGTLLYATCSLFPEENEKVIEKFLNSFPGTYTTQKVMEHHPIIKQRCYDYTHGIQILPVHKDLDGMYAALLIKN